MLKIFELPTKEDKKHSVRYSTVDPEAPVDNVYVKRSAFPGGMPEKLFVAVSDDPIPDPSKKK